MRIRSFAYTITAILICSLGFLVVGNQPVSAHDKDYLISNSKFRDYNSMSRSEIQKFLDERGGALATWSGGDAAQIIYDAAQDYGVSPKVIMATLQKEQSLITDPDPHHTQYDYAMGYGCPTTGSCSYPGFETQVRYGTWQLRFNYERARGNNSWWNNANYACASETDYYKPGLFPGNTVKFYDHVYGKHYATVQIRNAATASLYCYTPHVYNPSGDPVYYSGSYNFVRSYEMWWGSTKVAVQRVRSDDGHPTQYVVYDGKKQGIPSGDVLRAWGIDELPLQTWAREKIDNTPNHKGVLSRKVKHVNHSVYYLIDNGGGYTANRGNIRSIWGFPGSPSEVSNDLLELVNVSGSLTQFATTNESSTIYLVDDGELAPISSPAVLHVWRSNEPIRTISTSLENRMPKGSSVSHNRVSDGDNEYIVSRSGRHKIPDALKDQYPHIAMDVSSALIGLLSDRGNLTRFIRSSSGGGVYIVDSGTRHGLPSQTIYRAYRSSNDPHKSVTTLHRRAFSLIESSGNQRSVLIGNETGYYKLDNGSKRPVPEELHSLYSISSKATHFSSSLLDLFPAKSEVTPFVSSPSSPAVFLLDNGTRRGISNPTRLAQLRPSGVSITNLTNHDLSSYEYKGNLTAFLSDGMSEYLLDGGQKYLIEDEKTKNDWALTESSLRKVSTDTLAYFNNGGSLTAEIRIGNGYYLVTEGSYYSTRSNNIADIWNISSPITLTNNAIRSLADKGSLTRFVESTESSNRTVYTIDNGELLGLTSINQLFNIGYRGENIVRISEAEIQERSHSNRLHRFLAKNEDGAMLVFDNGRLRLVPSEHIDDWRGDHAPTTLSTSYLALLDTNSDLHGSVKNSSSATIYAIIDGEKRAISGPAVYREHYSPHSNISKRLTDLIPTGSQAPDNP